MTDSIMTTDAKGNKIWKNEKGELHRTDGPAVEKVDGTKEWWVNGLRHRTDGPAIEWSNGIREYWVNGELQQTESSDSEWVKGFKEGFLEGFKAAMKNS